jgi:hypothetical protein
VKFTREIYMQEARASKFSFIIMRTKFWCSTWRLRLHHMRNSFSLNQGSLSPSSLYFASSRLNKRSRKSKSSRERGKIHGNVCLLAGPLHRPQSQSKLQRPLLHIYPGKHSLEDTT